MLKATNTIDKCTNVRHTEELVTDVQNVSLQQKENASIIVLSISALAYTLNHRTV